MARVIDIQTNREAQIPAKMAALAVSRQEAVNIIGLLAGQLGQQPLTGNASGACPEVITSGCRLSIIVDDKAP